MPRRWWQMGLGCYSPPFGGGVGWLLLTLVLGFGGLASRQAVREGFGLRTGSASSERKLTPLSPTLNRF